MTIGFMKKTDTSRLMDRHGLKHIMGNYYYLPMETYGEYNFLFIVPRVIKGKRDNRIEPVEFMQMLTELSSRVKVGNTFTDVAICLGLPTDLQYKAQNIDKSFADFALGIN